MNSGDTLYRRATGRQIGHGGGSTRADKVIWAVLARYVTISLFFDALAPLFPQMAASYSVSTSFFQGLLGACFIAFALAQLLSVSAIRAVGLYRCGAVSSVYLGIASVLICGTQSPILFSALLVSMFAANSIGSSATRVALRDATSDEGFKRLFAWASAAVQIKQIAMPFLAGAMAAALGWRWALTILVAPVVAAGIWMQIVDCRRSANSTHAIVDVVPSSSWYTILATRTFLKATLIAAAFQISFSPLVTRLPFVLANEANLAPAMVGLLISVASGFIAASLLATGYVVSWWRSDQLIGIGIVIMAISLLLMYTSVHIGICYAFAGMILMQGALGFIVVPCSGDALSACGTQRAAASALFGFLQSAMGGLSVAITGAVGASDVSISIALTAISICLIIILNAETRSHPS